MILYALIINVVILVGKSGQHSLTNCGSNLEEAKQVFTKKWVHGKSTDEVKVSWQVLLHRCC